MSLDHEVFALGRETLQSGVVLDDARLAWRSFGTLSAAKDNVVVMPTYYTGSHRECAHMVGPDRALDPRDWFIVVPNLLGNGVSTSPSNASAAQAAADFPLVTVADNVRMQRRWLRETWGIEQVALVVGWSMGAQQAYEWAASEPQTVRALAPICGSARTSPHNQVFLEGVRAALMADPAFDGGRYREPPLRGLSAFGRVYAGWAYSQAFFRDGLYRELGCASANEVLERWDAEHRGWDANDLLAMLATWQHADISNSEAYGKDLNKALGAIEARTIVMPCAADLYFPPEDSRREVTAMRNAELRVLESPWGHLAGSPLYDAPSKAVIDAALRELLHAS